MISNVYELNSSQYLQSFGKKVIEKKDVKNSNSSNIKTKATAQQSLSKKTNPIPFYITNMLDKNSFARNLSSIKAVERLCLSVKNAVPYDSLEVKNYCVGNSPEEKLFNALTHPDIFFLKGKPYTGYAKEVSDDGDGIYSKFENGILQRTFMKNPETGFIGYTDEKSECAKYYKETPTKKTLLTSMYIGNGVNKVKLINVTQDGMTVKSYLAADDVTDKEYQRLTSDVKKAFGADLSGDSYYLFA